MTAAHVPTINNPICGSPTLSFVQRGRRQHHRFPIMAQAEYIFSGHRAQATTLDIGSGGVLLRTDTILRVGRQIEVLIDWPVLLDARCPLRLAVFGNVIRSDWAGTAVEITRYEFRIRGGTQSPARRSA